MNRSIKTAAAVRPVLDALERRQMLSVDVGISFQPARTAAPSGFIVDVGDAFADRGDGLSFGWNATNPNGRDRNADPRQEFDTFNHLQRGGAFRWELQVPNGRYDVELTAGDASFADGRHVLRVEEAVVMDFTPSDAERFKTVTASIDVTDGRLTLRHAPGASNAKVNYIRVKTSDVQPPVTPGVGPTINVNFQPDGAPVPDGFRADIGASFGLRANRLTYGWHINGSPFDNRSNTRDRNILTDQRYDTFNHSQRNGNNLTWEILVPNGTYEVRVAAGDAGFFDGSYGYNVEGVSVLRGTPSSSSRFVEGTVTVNVTDGRLTLTNGPGASNNKVAFLTLSGRPYNPNPDPEPEPTLVSISANQPSAAEGSPVIAGSIRFTRSGSLSDTLNVPISVSGTATPGSDFTALPSSISFSAGQSVVDLPITPIDDSTHESTESVVVTIGSGVTVSGASFATVNIADNDPAPQLSLRWTQTTNSPITRVEAQSAVVDGRLYVFGGYSQNWVPNARSDVYNPATGQWSRIADLPKGTTHAGTAVVGNDIWLAGGYTDRGDGVNQDIAVTQVIIYNTLTNTYRNGPSLPEQRGSGGLAHVDGKLYFHSGERRNRTNASDMWMLDLANQSAGWVRRANHPFAMSHFGTAVIDGQIYSIGGQTGVDAGASYFPNSYRYNPATDSWSRIADLPFGLSHLSPNTVVRDGRIVIFGGERGFNVDVNNVQEYNPATNSWRQLTALPVSRAAGVAGWLGDRFVFATGKRSGWNNQAYVGQFV